MSGRVAPVVLLLLTTVACRQAGVEPIDPEAAPGPVTEADSRAVPAARFHEVTTEAGLDFHHRNGMTGELYIVEMMGGGGALLDYDNDGDLDLYLRQGGALDPATAPSLDGSDRLFRNDLHLEAGRTVVRFVDVTDDAGIDDFGYGMGIAVGDYDADGWLDLYLTNFGPNRLLRNRGDGTFADVTLATGTDDSRWSVPAVFADLDADGWLDLWVGNYIDFTLASHKTCRRASSVPDYCGPMSYEPVPDRMLRNRGDGTFEDVTAAWGMAAGYGSALGVIVGDFTRDGRLDLYVANDAMENQLWLVQADGTWHEEALVRGCAVNGRGEREGSMGVTAGDVDLDGDEDLFITHMTTESNTLYINEGSGEFRDGSLVAGLASNSRPFTGFGTLLFDYDCDGRDDILVVNGAVRIIEELEAAGEPFPLRQTNQLYRNHGDGTFENVSDAAGALTARSEVSRGAIFGDLDNNGRIDVVVVNNNGPARAFTNQDGERRPWLGLAAAPGTGGPGLETAWIGLDGVSPAASRRRLRSTASYASANDPRGVLCRMGGVSGGELRIAWPGVTKAIAIRGVETGYYYVLADDRSVRRRIS